MSAEREPGENEPDWLDAAEWEAGEDGAAKEAAPGGERAEGVTDEQGEAARHDEQEGRAEAGPEADDGLPSPGDMEDAGPAEPAGDPRAGDPQAGEEPGGELRRFNENTEQMLESMDGLLEVLLKTQARLDAAGSEGGKKADGGEAAPAEAGEDGETVQIADFYRWIETDRRRRRRWSLAAMAAAAPAALLLGVLVQHQFQPIPLHDPSGGWSGWIWETHGRAIVDCAVDAMRTNAEVDCPLVVRRP